MTARAVHWHEGMFLRPHHLQAAERHLVGLQRMSDSWDVHYNWGLRDFQLDADALGNHRLVIRKLRVRLRDGLLVSAPEDGELPALELKPLLESESSIMVHLGVPVVHLGRPNVAGMHPGEGGRYLVDTLDLEDENTGLNPQPIQVRRLNFKLLLSSQDHTGYEVIPLVRLEKSSSADGTPRVHLPYIPPVVACDAWAPLQQDILQSIYDRLGRKIELLADQMVTRGISPESQAAGDARIISQLRCLNETYAVLHVLAFARGVHPLEAYTELCRLLGQLALYGPQRRPPTDLPRYDHDNLGGCFYRIRHYIDGLFDAIVEPEYTSRPFQGTGLRMQVAIEPGWLESQWDMYVGVKSPLPTEQCVRMWTRAYFDMKIGSSQEVDNIFEKRTPGLRFSYVQTPPRALPTQQGLIYFQISRDSDEWENVRRSLTLAIRVRKESILGSIEGQRILTIRTPEGQTSTMELILYVVKQQR